MTATRGIGAATSRGRRVQFIAGFALLCAAQYLCAQTAPVPVVVRFPFTNALNQYWHIDVPNLGNVVVAVMCLALGGYVIAHGLVGFAPLDAVVTPRRGGLPAPSVASSRSMQTSVMPLLLAAPLFGLLIWRVAQGDSNNMLVVVWVVALALIALAAFMSDQHVGASLLPRLDRWDIAMIGLIFVAGLVIGTIRLDTVPNSLVGDEGSFLERASADALGKEAQPFWGFGVYSYPIPSSLYQGWIVKLLGLSLWSWRFSSVVAAVLAVIPTYLIARELFDRRVAILAGLVMVVTPYFLAFERLGYNNSQAILPVALCFYLLYTGLQRESVGYVAVGAIAGGLGFYTYTSGRLGLVVGTMFVLCLVVAAFIGKFPQSAIQSGAALMYRRRRLALMCVAFIGVGIITVAPEIVYGTATNPAELRYKTLESLFPNVFYAQTMFSPAQLFRDHPPITLYGQAFFFRPDLYGILLVRGLIRSLLAFHQNSGLVEQHYIAGPLAGPIAVLFYVVGLALTVTRLWRREYLLLGFWFFGGLLLLSIGNTFPPRYQHLIAIIPAMSIITAVGILTCADWLGVQLQRARLPGAIAGAVFVVVLISGLWNYFVVMPGAYPPDLENVIAFNTLEQTRPRNVVFVSSAPERKRFVPLLLQNLPYRGTYHTVAGRSFVRGAFPINHSEDYTFYFTAADCGFVEPYLQRRFNGPGSTPSIYTDSSGRPVVLSITFGH